MEMIYTKEITSYEEYEKYNFKYERQVKIDIVNPKISKKMKVSVLKYLDGLDGFTSVGLFFQDLENYYKGYTLCKMYVWAMENDLISVDYDGRNYAKRDKIKLFILSL